MSQLIAIALAYLIGSISFGILVATSQGVDIRTVGSGNPGMSNVMRVMGKRSAALVLVGDGFKGAAAAAVGALVVDPTFGYVTLLAGVVGHAYPVWHRFRGGKSVAATLGGIIYLAPVVGVALGVIWVAIVVVWKKASVGSLVVMLSLVPALAVAGRSRAELLWAAVIAAFVLIRHAGNVKRLVTSSEESVA